jgi:hypothetical protein
MAWYDDDHVAEGAGQEKMPDISFHHIRPLNGDKRYGFEEFICQLARRETAPEGAEFRRIDGAGGDGGVEAYWLLRDGTEQGYQAKYFRETKEIDWRQVDKSVKAALQQHRTLTHYTIAFACDLTDRSGSMGRGKMGWEHWATHKAKWEQWAAAQGMSVEFSHWTKSAILDKLAAASDSRGLTLFWFDADILNAVWFSNLFDRACADLDDRYHPEDHVQVSLAEAFEGLTRSQRYLDDLSIWFAAIPHSADLLGQHERLGFPKDKTVVVELGRQCDTLHDIAQSLNGYGARPFPIVDWVAMIAEALTLVGHIQEEIYKNDDVKVKDQKYLASQYYGELAAHFDTPPFHLAGGEHSLAVEADLHRLLLLVGEAGVGKSHLCASAVDAVLTAGKPAVLLLGQSFTEQDLRHEFLRALEMAHRDFTDVLGALNAAGEAAQTRAVVLIDAVNEAGDLRIWRNQLAGFVAEIRRYEWLALGISIRPEYEAVLIPAVVRNQCARVTCRGITLPEEQAQAAVQYFEKRGITRPAVPWLAPEFTNFLFLRTCCEALQAQHLHEFPRGLHGSLKVFAFYLKSIERKLGIDFPNAVIPEGVVGQCLLAIAATMATTHVDFILRAHAIDVCTQRFGYRGPTGELDWFRVLTQEGVFRRDHLFDTEKDDPLATSQEIYRFTYQRFSDHLIVKALLQEVEDIHGAFEVGAPLGFIFEKTRHWSWVSLFGALAVQIPETYPGVELLDVTQSWIEKPRYAYAILNAFEESLLWRADTAFTEHTWEFFNRLQSIGSDPRPEIMLRLSTLQTHPGNADRLNRSLQRLSMPERDALWTVNINAMTNDEHCALWELIHWGTTAPLTHVEPETLRLAAMAVAWTLTSSSRLIRDKSTKALIAIFINRPEVLPGIVRAFGDVDDLYVMERICAAVLGAVTHGMPREGITAAADAIYDVVFCREIPHLNIALRDYARAVVEYAAHERCLGKGGDLAKCRPPYHSPWPLQETSEAELKAIAKDAGGDEIMYSSTQMLGDFGTYEITPLIHHFTSIPLTEPRPLNRDEIAAAFRQLRSLWDEDKQEGYLALETAVALEGKARWSAFRILDDVDTDVVVPSDLPDIIARLEKALLAVLSAEERDAYERMAVPSLFPERAPSLQDQPPKLDTELAQRWVARRAYEYGWTSRLFPHDRGEGYTGRDRPRTERIGKKYQWLALSELAARLTDNVWIIERYPERAMPYDHPADDWFIRDVEPSLITTPIPVTTRGGWWQTTSLDLDPIDGDGIGAWPFQGEQLSTSDWIDVVDPDGRPWSLVYGMFNARENRGTTNTRLLAILRDVFVRVSTVIISSSDIEEAMTILRDERLADPSGHKTADLTDGPFLCEYGWRDTWWHDDDPFEEGFREFEGIRYMRPVSRHTWESHLDLSLPKGSSICVPRPWLGNRLSLRPNPARPWEFVSTNHGGLVFFDPSIGADSTAALINKDVFVQALAAEGLECLWIVAGERSSFPSGRDGDYAIRSSTGIYRWKDGRWQGAHWHEDQRGTPRR